MTNIASVLLDGNVLFIRNILWRYSERFSGRITQEHDKSICRSKKKSILHEDSKETPTTWTEKMQEEDCDLKNEVEKWRDKEVNSMKEEDNA